MSHKDFSQSVPMTEAYAVQIGVDDTDTRIVIAFRAADGVVFHRFTAEEAREFGMVVKQYADDFDEPKPSQTLQ